MALPTKQPLDQEALQLAQKGLRRAPVVPTSNMQSKPPQKKVMRMGLAYPGLTPTPQPAPQPTPTPQAAPAPPPAPGTGPTFTGQGGPAMGAPNSLDLQAARGAATQYAGAAGGGGNAIHVTGPGKYDERTENDAWYNNPKEKGDVLDAIRSGQLSGGAEQGARDDVADADSDAQESGVDQMFDADLEELLGSGPRDTSEEEAVAREEIQRQQSQNTADLMSQMGAAGYGTSGAQVGMIGDLNSQAAFNAQKSLQGIRQDARDEELQRKMAGIEAYFRDRGLDMTEDQYGRILDILEAQNTPGDVMGDSNGDGTVDQIIDSGNPFDPEDDKVMAPAKGVTMTDPQGRKVQVPENMVWFYQIQGWSGG